MRLHHLVPVLFASACLMGADADPAQSPLDSAQILARAEVLVKDQKSNDAIELLTAWTREHPEDTAAKRRLLNLQVATKEAEIRDLVRQQADDRDLMMADQEYEDARKRASTDVVRRLRAAEYLIAQNRQADALEAVNRILRDHPEDPACLRIKIRLLDYLTKKQREALERNRAAAREGGINTIIERDTLPTDKPKIRRQVFVFDEDIDELERARVTHRLQEKISLTQDKAKVWDVMQQLFSVAGINYVVLDSAIGDETVTLNIQNDTIQSALEAIGKLAQVRFAYNRGTVFVSNDADESLVTEIIRLKSGLTNVDQAAPGSSFGGSGGSGSSSSSNANNGTANGTNTTNPNPTKKNANPTGANGANAANAAKAAQGGSGADGGLSDLEKFLAKVPEIIVGWPDNGKIYLDRKSNTLYIRSTPWGLSELKRLLAAMDYNNVQVLIQARFVEVEESAMRELGVDWGGQYGGSAANPIVGGSFGLLGANPKGVAQNAGQEGGLITGVFTSGKTGIKATLTALESQGKSDTLAEPKILALNNQEGLISITTSTPYIANYTTQSYNNNAVTNPNTGTIVNQTVVATPVIETVDSGYELKIRPSIARNSDIITLRVIPTIQDLIDLKDNPSGFTGPDGTPKNIVTPIISKRSLETTLHIKNGEGVAMGGLIKERDQSSKSGTPFLSELPVLGHLFRHDSAKNKRSNLVIIITADIVDPSGAHVGDEIEKLRDTARILLPPGDNLASDEPVKAPEPVTPAPEAGPSKPTVSPANYRGDR